MDSIVKRLRLGVAVASLELCGCYNPHESVWLPLLHLIHPHLNYLRVAYSSWSTAGEAWMAVTWRSVIELRLDNAPYPSDCANTLAWTVVRIGLIPSLRLRMRSRRRDRVCSCWCCWAGCSNHRHPLHRPFGRDTSALRRVGGKPVSLPIAGLLRELFYIGVRDLVVAVCQHGIDAAVSAVELDPLTRDDLVREALVHRNQAAVPIYLELHREALVGGEEGLDQNPVV